jgi:hypothetical protein
LTMATPDVFLLSFDMLRSNTGFVVKELCIYNVTAKCIQTFSFKPPFPECILSAKTKKTNSFVTRKIHGLTWNDGYIDYDHLPGIIRKYIKTTDIAYVKGLENLRFMQYLVPGLTCKNLETEMKCLDKDDVEQQQPTFSTLDKNTSRCLTRALKWGGILMSIFQLQHEF